jgi:hypothetical protein
MSSAPSEVGPLGPSGSPLEASPRARYVFFLACAAISLLPIALACYPPVLDLPQQMAQLPLVEEALGEASSRYLVQWFAPNKLSYPLLGIGWWLGGPTLGPRFGLALCLVAALGATHLLAAYFDRPLANVALASLFVWSLNLYWGFFNFVLGAVPLALWLRELGKEANDRPLGSRFLPAFLAGLLFYWSHVLWLAAALGILLLFALLRPRTRSLAPIRLLALAPFLMAAATWSWSTAEWVIEKRVLWDLRPLERLASPWLWLSNLVGGIGGPLQKVTLGAVAAWALVALVSARLDRRPLLDPVLGLAALAFAGAAYLLPNRIDETLHFASRWGGQAAVCLVLALPALPLSRRWASTTALAGLTAFVGFTAEEFIRFDRNAMSGFDSCRAAVPEGARLLSLDFSRFSPPFLHPTTFQMGAYVQLDRRVDLAFSFAEHRSSLVVLRTLPRPIQWTRKLEHYPQHVQPRDFDSFDFVLVRVPIRALDQISGRFPRLERVTGEGEWWLYRVKSAGPGGVEP